MKMKINERFNENGFQNECNFPTLYATYIYSGVIHEIQLKRKTIERLQLLANYYCTPYLLTTMDCTILFMGLL